MEPDEFRKPEFRTIADAIRVLRPDWLNARSAPKVADPRSGSQESVLGVFIEGQGRGYTLEKLSEYVPNDIRSVRRIQPSEAMATYGPQWNLGGIVLVLAR